MKTKLIYLLPLTAFCLCSCQKADVENRSFDSNDYNEMYSTPNGNWYGNYNNGRYMIYGFNVN